MSANLCNDIDAYLAAAIAADMGAGTYGSDEITTVLMGETFNPDQHTLPAALIRGQDVEHLEQYPQQDQSIHLDRILYQYEIVTVGEAATEAAAWGMASELRRRAREMFRARFALGGLTSSDGETVILVRIGRGTRQVRGRAGTNRASATRYLAIAQLAVEIEAKI